MQKQYQDGFWSSRDGLQLHYRDYPGRADRPPLLCVPGLTRNARDFAHVAERLAGEWRVICVDLRGRGDSAHARDPMTYLPAIYLQDLEDLIGTLALHRIVMLGTSLGGLLTMMMAAAHPGRLAGALLNDVGPAIEQAGLQRIVATIEKSGSWPSWVHAGRAASEIYSAAHPHYDLNQWITLAKRLYRLTQQGRIVQDYDSKITVPMRQPAEVVDLWPLFDALADVPTTILRGALSDILTPATATEMTRRLRHGRLVTIADTGHPPELDEPDAIAAIDALLAAVSA